MYKGVYVQWSAEISWCAKATSQAGRAGLVDLAWNHDTTPFLKHRHVLMATFPNPRSNLMANRAENKCRQGEKDPGVWVLSGRIAWSRNSSLGAFFEVAK